MPWFYSGSAGGVGLSSTAQRWRRRFEGQRDLITLYRAISSAYILTVVPSENDRWRRGSTVMMKRSGPRIDP